jgi:hypothetical protein
MKRILALALALCISTLGSSIVRADATVGVDPNQTWLGYMNVSELPANGGFFVFGSGWGVPDLVATFGGSTLTLAPNSVNDPNPFWYTPSGGPGSTGNKITEANVYVEATDVYAGQTLTFEGTVLTNTFTSEHSTIAFIKDFAPDYSSFNLMTTDPLNPGDFSLSLALDPGAGRHVQYGFATTGPCVWITDVAPFGTMTIATEATSIPGDFDNDGDVDGRDFLLWQRDTNEGSLADWQLNYGTGTGELAAVSSVPEPASLSLIAGLVCVLGMRRSR